MSALLVEQSGDGHTTPQKTWQMVILFRGYINLVVVLWLK